MRKEPFFSTIALVLSLLLASCGPAAAPTPPAKAAATPTAPAKAPAAATPAAKPPAPAPSPKPVGGQPKSGGMLTASIYADPPSLDPHQETSFIALTVAQPAMNGLIDFDPNDITRKIRPALAEKWELSKDGTVLTFDLRKGVTWHDGKPFSSADAKASLERAGVNPPKGAVSPLKSAFQPVAKMETPDDYTLRLTLNYPYAEILDVVAAGYNLMMPKASVDALGGAKIRRADQIVGTGPFKPKSYDSGVGWTFVKNAAYFKKGLPHLDELRYYVIKDESTRFSAFRTKRVLVEAKSPGFSPAQKEALEKSPEAGQIVLSQGMPYSLWVLQLNTRSAGPIGDVRVRKAIHLAVDRQRMKKLHTFQPPPIIGGVIFPESKFAIPAETIEKMPGFRQPKDDDIAESNRLLEEAKVPKGTPLTVITREVANYRDQAIILTEELKLMGFAATIKLVDTATIYEVMDKRDFAALSFAYSSWSTSPHFEFGARFVAGGGRDYEGVSDERLNSLYARQARSLDVEERKRLFWEMERILREEIVPAIPFYWATKVTGHWREVKGHPGFGLGYYEGNSMEEVWLDK
ncbi:MAG: ABC transporter substrate-binding protein [Chloroflexi bacterium]|nr:ABC transporter substrate-binding protein [Chloroflexota bacterium]